MSIRIGSSCSAGRPSAASCCHGRPIMRRLATRPYPPRSSVRAEGSKLLSLNGHRGDGDGDGQVWMGTVASPVALRVVHVVTYL